MFREGRRPTALQLRFLAERERRKRRRSTQGKLPTLAKQYADRPIAYIEEQLGWTPWEGDEQHPGQVEIVEAYRHSIRQQQERRDFNDGLLTESQLRYWTPGEPIRNEIHVQAGHGVGKSKMLSGLVNHFLDCFVPSIVQTYAPSAVQLTTTTWKEIKTDRLGKGLPGRVLPQAPKIYIAANHFAIGRTTNNNKGLGTEMAQGQHGPFLMFVLDEAEGVPGYVYDAIQSMKSGGVVIVIRVGNPKTRTSRFFRAGRGGRTRRFVMNSIHHPNVRAGTEVVKGGAVTREWVEEMIGEYAHPVQEHDEDAFTFELPWDATVPVADDLNAPPVVYPAGTIFRPENDFLWRVMGIAPPTGADKTLIPVGRFEAAVKRGIPFRPGVQAAGLGDMTTAAIGCDAARFGLDKGTIYVRQGNLVWRAGSFAAEDYDAYDRALTKVVADLIAAGVKRIDLRLDGGGGYGGGVAALVKKNTAIRKAVKDAGVRFQMREVLNNWAATDGVQWANLITELYGAAAEAVRDLAIVRPVPELEIDLTGRRFAYKLRGVHDTKELEKKEKFREREGHSPDDGDGFVLAVAPTSLLGRISATAGRSHTYFTFN